MCLTLHTWRPNMNQPDPECQVNPPPSPADPYLGGPVGVHQNHVLGALFDLELDVILPFQGGQAAAAGAHSRLTVGGIWGHRAFWVKTKKVQVTTLWLFGNNHRYLTLHVSLESVTNIHRL